MARVHHGEPVGVGQRQHRHRPVLASQLVKRRGRPRVRLQVVVRERHAFGHPGGARGVEDDRQVLGPALHRREAVGLVRGLCGQRARLAVVAAAVHQQHVVEARQHADPGLDLPQHVGRGDGDLGLGVGEDVGHLPVAEEEDHRNDDPSALEDRRVALGDLRAIGQHDHHPVPRRNAEPAEGVGQATRGAVLLQVRVPAPLEGERHVLPVAVEALLGEARERHEGDVSSW